MPDQSLIKSKLNPNCLTRSVPVKQVKSNINFQDKLKEIDYLALTPPPDEIDSMWNYEI